MELSSWISKDYLSAARIRDLRKQYARARPTQHTQLTQFFKPAKMRELRAALRQLEFARKEADLFSFAQTGDLHAAKNKTIREFLKLLTSKEFTAYLQQITGADISAGKVDAAGFSYTSTDHLLCHDDRLASRRLAYVVNLSTPKQGGALAFFDTDSKKQPTTVAKRVYPQENAVVFFTVTPTSHHMVEEVIKGERLSIAGWFHA